MDKICPKSATVFISQMIVVIGVVTAAIINLSISGTENREMWISLLCSTIGYILPAPKLRKPSTKDENERTTLNE